MELLGGVGWFIRIHTCLYPAVVVTEAKKRLVIAAQPQSPCTDFQ